MLLSFSEELIPETVSVSVADGTGFVVTVAAPDVDDADVSFPWPPALTGPDYTVNYRVVSQDRPPRQRLAVLHRRGAGASLRVSGPEPSVGSTLHGAGRDSASSPAESTDTASAAADGSGIPFGAIIAVAVGLAIGIAVGFVLIGRRRSAGSP